MTPDAWKVETQTDFFCSYAVAVQQEDYRQAVRMLFGQYDRYIRLKLEEDDSGLAGQMTGYPAGICGFLPGADGGVVRDRNKESA